MEQKRVGIVTGASSGIGKLLAEGLPSHCEVDEIWAIARSKERLEQLAPALPVPVRAVAMDLTREESLTALGELLHAERPDVRVLINAGGFGVFERFDRISEEDAAGMIDLNCRALTLLMRTVLPYCTRGPPQRRTCCRFRARSTANCAPAAYACLPYALIGPKRPFLTAPTATPSSRTSTACTNPRSSPKRRLPR